MSDKHVLFPAVGALLLLALSAAPGPARFIWNRTESLPTGLYMVLPERTVHPGDLVAYAPSEKVRHWIESRGYTRRSWPLLKRVAGLEGDCVCRFQDRIFVNGIDRARALGQDRSGRSLPVWKGCRRLSENEVFLLADHPASLDGRYFGAQARAGILGVAVPAWLPGKASAEAERPAPGTRNASENRLGARRTRLRDCHRPVPDPLADKTFCRDMLPGARVTPGPACGAADD